jgi:pseudouridine kinase
VWVRRGEGGSVLSGRDGAATFPALDAEVVDVTGAGDAMLAAYCHAILHGADPASAAAHGHAAAALTIASPHTVRPDLTSRLIEDLLA